MTLEECYIAIDGDYADVLGRLRSERLVQKFVLKFLSDDSCDTLRRALEAQNYQEAFRAAHTLKGVCQNLSITRLGKSSGLLTEALRNGWTPEAAPLAEQVYADYQQAVEAIRAYQEALPS